MTEQLYNAWVMKKIFLFIGIAALGFLVCILYINRYRGEKYQILYTVFVPGGELDLPDRQSVICYSSEQLRQALKSTDILERFGANAYDLDKPDIIACVISNYTVEKVVGRQGFGLIVLQRSPTNGVSFTVFRGTKRFLQFYYPQSTKKGVGSWF